MSQRQTVAQAASAQNAGLSNAAIVALAAITLLALALRLYRLGEIPPGLFLDEAGNGLDALDVLAGRFSLFFGRSLGKEPLFNYLIVPFVAWLGRDPLAVRLPAALAGAAAVPATFLLARELLWREGAQRATWAALLVAGLLATSFWAITVNRISFRANTLPVVLALAFWLSWRTLRLGGRWQAALAGGLLGVCFYTYLAGRFVYPLALTAVGILAMRSEGRAQLRLRRQELLLMALVCAGVMLPLALYFVTHWQDFLTRASLVVTADPSFNRGPDLSLLRQSIAGHLGMFGGPGDYEPRHNIPDRSALTPWLAILFWTGVALALLRGWRRPERWFALAWFMWLLLPSVVAVVTPRHFLRIVGLLPIVYLFPALTLLDLHGWAGRRLRAATLHRFTTGIVVFGIALVSTEAVFSAHDYFNRYASDSRTASAFMAYDSLIAQEINAAPDGVRYVLPLNDRWAALGNKYTFDFLLQQPQIVHPFFPAQPGAVQRLADAIQQPGVHELRIVRVTEGDDVSGDPAELASLLAGQLGQPLGTDARPGYYIERFHLDGAAAPAHLPEANRSATLTFGRDAVAELTLEKWGVNDSGPAVSSGGLGAAVLQWRIDQAPGRLLSASLRLLDGLDNVVGQADHLLVDERPQYADHWQGGDQITTYLPVTAAPGTPPGVYRLALIVYETDGMRRLALTDAEQPADMAILGFVEVGAPRAHASFYQPTTLLSAPWPVNLDVNLVGHEGIPADGLPGLALELTLALERNDDSSAEVAVRLALGEQEWERVMLSLPQGGPWRVPLRFRLPPDLRPGDYVVRLGGIDDSQWLDLGSVAVAAPPEPLAVLDARFANGMALDGWRLDQVGDGSQVTLFWRTDQSLDQAYTVFVHVLDANGQIVAQHDAQPDNGRYPTTTWTPGMTVPDRHALDVATVQPGMGLRVGLYLPGSGVRVPMLDGRDSLEWALEEMR